ncbi:MAG: LysM peptidoglycan-binding domain-containing protein [Bacillota bacterium]
MKKYVIGFIVLTVMFISLATGAADTYQVKNGDTLLDISRRFDVPVRMIINQNDISSPSNIYVGQTLTISHTGNSITITFGDNSGYSQEEGEYTVKSGDTMWKIARKFDTTIEGIIDLNEDISYGSCLYIGQQLRVPAENTQPVTQPDQNYVYYTVRSGDILWNIARKYNTTVASLVRLNDIRDSYDLYPGRRLLVKRNYDYQLPENNNDQQTNYVPYYSYIPSLNNQLNHYYRVGSGETLTEIADYYNVDIEALRKINNLTEVDSVYRGQRLRMPVSPVLFQNHSLYTVSKNNQPIHEIAYKHGVTIRSILQANYLKNINQKFSAGTKLLIPLDNRDQTVWIDYEDGKPVNGLFNN